MTPVVTRSEVELSDGRILVVHDSGAHDSDGENPTAGANPADAGNATDELTLLWHHGSPHTGALLTPILAAAQARGVRLVSYGRPSYGGSSPLASRDVASAARDVEQLMDSLGVARFATMGASGGGPHALACAALLPNRVIGVVTLAGIAPMTGEASWFDGMAAPGGLQAALGGRAARALFAQTDEFDPSSFVAADYEALEGDWSVLGDDVGRSAEWGDDGLIDDDVAFASPWGFPLEAISAPTLLVQGRLDRVVPAAHADLLHGRIRGSELRMRDHDGHVSVLGSIPAAIDWLRLQLA